MGVAYHMKHETVMGERGAKEAPNDEPAHTNPRDNRVPSILPSLSKRWGHGDIHNRPRMARYNGH